MHISLEHMSRKEIQAIQRSGFITFYLSLILKMVSLRAHYEPHGEHDYPIYTRQNLGKKANAFKNINFLKYKIVNEKNSNNKIKSINCLSFLSISSNYFALLKGEEFNNLILDESRGYYFLSLNLHQKRTIFLYLQKARKVWF